MGKSSEQDVKDLTNPEVNTTDEQSQVEDKGAGKSDKSTSTEQENLRLRGQIAALQKKLEEQDKFNNTLKTAIIGEQKQEVSVNDIVAEIKVLKEEIKKKDLELQKSSYIDSLDVPEAKKRYLKAKVRVDSDDLQSAIESELKFIDDTFGSFDRPISDTRPRGESIATISDGELDARDILKDPIKYKKMLGL